MCVAVYLPSGKDITNDTLEACHKTNKDSVGYMYNVEGLVYIERFLDFHNFKKSFRAKRKQFPNADFVLHFRIGTSGKIDIPNCHPFRLTSDIGLVHNGVLRCINGDAKESDTNKFSQMLTDLLHGKEDVLWGNARFWEFIQESIGAGNKLILLRGDGDFKIVNEKAGTWESGVWFSNTSWKFRTSNYTPTVYTRNTRPINPELAVCTECKEMLTFYSSRVCQECYPTWSTTWPKNGTNNTPAVDPDAPKYGILIHPDDLDKNWEGVTYIYGIDADKVEVILWKFEKELYLVIESNTAKRMDESMVGACIKYSRWEIPDPSKFGSYQIVDKTKKVETANV